jgi:UDP-glucose 4-epimerase
VFGDDYDTPDGTGVRDYIHVVDPRRRHVGRRWTTCAQRRRSLTINLGTGRGHSVLELVHAFEPRQRRPLPCRIVARRRGDLGAYYADPTRAREVLWLDARYDLDRMCADTWRWQSLNPNGFAPPPHAIMNTSASSRSSWPGQRHPAVAAVARPVSQAFLVL